ncbi:hypothetical protein [Pseudoalteromonas ruthenica]|uniref:Uncharacterized protein n=1 Tax=Pseudoalteromonas ruthenica TaxID=151081 RepID=A0A0F4PQP6_9GAMM|nr:hypothetical protein [Pseudoalteromonas ruthenica]KJY97383.1 hypothetical protein TW76_09810 [Pseudoalteromonas ruthenica]KJY99331.1 hypothetical protein TW72_10710 [Pseudoalteromonas ruthenica]TMO86202.1 hypothetical protein CWC12_14260 [Pseudoalteromonas ruthenica]TMO90938.1 hypothetical protein CWC13_17110 [Pseudoalteromonas ruthenica]TMO98602.1 hypothetical protein CWC07_10930 [Pseudoalteromonas ruthenica]
MDLCITISGINWSLTKDVVSIVGTIGALTIGGLGLFTWSRQLRGTSEYEVAKKAILNTYEVQQALQSVRNPMLYLSKEEVEAGRRLEEEQRIYSERMTYLNEKWAELQMVRLEAKVIWGNEAQDSFNEIQQRIGDLRGAIWLHFWMKGAYAGPGATVDNSPERVRENDKTVYFTSEEDDFSQKIAESTAKVEKFFGSKVRTK